MFNRKKKQKKNNGLSSYNSTYYGINTAAGASRVNTTSGTFTTGSVGSTCQIPEIWTEGQKEALAKTGLVFDEHSRTWHLKLSVDISIKEMEDMESVLSGEINSPMDQLIKKIKYAKEELIKKLTAKMILAELIRPKEIKK
jgi:hypothetical protein